MPLQHFCNVLHCLKSVICHIWILLIPAPPADRDMSWLHVSAPVCMCAYLTRWREMLAMPQGRRTDGQTNCFLVPLRCARSVSSPIAVAACLSVNRHNSIIDTRVGFICRIEGCTARTHYWEPRQMKCSLLHSSLTILTKLFTFVNWIVRKYAFQCGSFFNHSPSSNQKKWCGDLERNWEDLQEAPGSQNK